MSANDDGGPGRRETAQRLFAAEFDDATHSYSESDEERAPNYVVAPTGARVNRLFAVGVLTEVETVSENVLRGRIVDPTGAFVLYAGQYQPDALAFLERTEPPAFVAVTGKARTFQPDDSDAIYTSVRPESLNEVDAETRDRWVVTTAERTVERVEAMRDAKARPERGDELESVLRGEGVAESLAAGIPRALDAYGTTDEYLDAVEGLSRDAVRVVAGEREEAGSLSVAPGEGEDAGTPTGSESAAAASDESGGAESERAAAEPDETGAASGAEDAASDGTGATEAAASDSVARTETERAGDESGASTAEEGQPSEPATEPDDTEPTDGEVSSTAESESKSESESESEFESESKSESGPESESGATDELYEFDEEERQQVEEEHGLDFSTGGEVEEADELGGFESGLSEAESAEEGAEAEQEPASATEETDASAAAEPTADFDDPEDAAVETMTDLAGGDAVERAALVDALTERYGVTAEDAEAAIEDALMSGRCYESGDGELTPI